MPAVALEGLPAHWPIASRRAVEIHGVASGSMPGVEPAPPVLRLVSDFPS